jgi:hypothetical protein
MNEMTDGSEGELRRQILAAGSGHWQLALTKPAAKKRCAARRRACALWCQASRIACLRRTLARAATLASTLPEAKLSCPFDLVPAPVAGGQQRARRVMASVAVHGPSRVDDHPHVGRKVRGPALAEVNGHNSGLSAQLWLDSKTFEEEASNTSSFLPLRCALATAPAPQEGGGGCWRPRLVVRASPVGHRATSGRNLCTRSHSAARPGPAAAWIAPSTPPPPSMPSFAALTMASPSHCVMSPLCRDPARRRRTAAGKQRAQGGKAEGINDESRNGARYAAYAGALVSPKGFACLCPTQEAERAQHKTDAAEGSSH